MSECKQNFCCNYEWWWSRKESYSRIGSVPIQGFFEPFEIDPIH